MPLNLKKRWGLNRRLYFPTDPTYKVGILHSDHWVRLHLGQKQKTGMLTELLVAVPVLQNVGFRKYAFICWFWKAMYQQFKEWVCEQIAVSKETSLCH
jgi:hypothetical protein